jgi:hypothetical protein
MRRLRRLAASALLFAAASPLAAQDLALMRLAAKCDTQIPWITDGYSSPDLGGPVMLPKDGPDRVALLDGALKRAADEKKLVFWYVQRIDGPQMYRPPILDDYLKVVAFTDERLTSVINARFIPLRMAADKAIGAKTGVKSLDWVEPAFAILGPDGKILRRLDRIRTFSAERFLAILLAVLEAHEALAPPPAEVVKMLDDAGDDAGKLTAAAGTAVSMGWRSGADRACAKLIERGNEVEGRLFHLQTSRDLETALERVEAFAAATEKLPDDHLFRSLATYARGKAALFAGKHEEAEKLLASIAGPKAPERIRPAALYRLATAQILNRKTRAAEETYRTLCSTFPDDARAWQAATNLITGRDTTPVGPAFHHFEDFSLPSRDDSAWVASAENTQHPREVREAPAVAARAVEWLLARQFDNGQWKDARYAYWSSPRILPNAWTAITAVAAAGLLDWREVDPKRVDAALGRAEKALFSEKNLARGQNEEIYADGFRALYLAKRLEAGGLDEAATDKARKQLDAVVKEIARQQSQTGFFGHEYPNPFTTGATLVVLDRARRAGATTGEGVFAEGVKALRGVRNEVGAFAYGEGRKPMRGDEALKNSAARSPVCEHALKAAGAGDDAALVAASDNWDRYLPRLEKVRVCDFHSDGELAGFFFWHGAYFASEAFNALPPTERASRADRLRDHVLKIVEADGSFVDSHEMGKSFATGMALMTLKNVLGPKPQ